ncbi:MAG: phage tail protein [Acidobacteriota bacterium]
MSEPYLGEIRMTGFKFAPYGWALCNGQLIAISQNAALFSLLGTAFGGDGVQTFGLPNLQGRMPINQGQGPGLPMYVMGEVGGNTSVTLNQQQMPQHTHPATFTPTGGGTPTVNVTVNGSNATGGTNAPAGNYLAGQGSAATGRSGELYVSNPASGTLGAIAGVSATISGGITGGTVTNALAGGNLPVQIQSPYLVVNFIIALLGIFPTRS